MNIAKKCSWVLLTCVSLGVTQTIVAATGPTGRPLKFYEAGITRITSFNVAGTSCTPTAQITCIGLDQYGSGSFSNVEIGSVNVSGSFGRSTLCANPNGQAIYTFMRRDPNGWDISAFSFDYRYELQSAVLNDLSILNPRTGQPFNGKISFPLQSTFLDQDYMGPLQRIVRMHRIGSLDCGFPVVTYGLLVTQYGLSSFDAQRVLGGALTIKLFIAGELRATDGGSYSMQLRMIGD